MIEKRVSNKFIFRLALAVLAAFLVPLLITSFYAAPAADDYSFGCVPHNVFVQTGSVWQTLISAVQRVGEVYRTWQGTYSAVFLFSLQPAVFGKGLYALTGFIMLGALTAGTFALCIALFRRVFGSDGYTGAAIAAGVTVVCTQLLPSPVQGFFWYNGAVYYTFFYGLSLAAFALGIRYVNFYGTSCFILLCVLCAVLGGGNYVTALTCLIVAVSSCSLLFILKDGRWKRLIVPTAVLLIGFGISIAAPGNAVRQATVAEHPNAVRAVVMSFEQGAVYGAKWFSLPLVGMLALISPVLWRAARRSDFAFRYPLPVTVYSYCLLSAMFCPSIYALGDVGEFRLLNIIYFAYVLLVTVNVFYWLGYIAARKNKKADAEITPGAAVIAAGVCGICCAAALMLNTGFASIGAVSTLRNGEASAFRECTEERLAVMNDEAVTDAVIPEYTVRPYILFSYDITDDPDDWTNEDMAHFYGKRSVTVG
ncbi:MAG: DUF6056 family protein [Eubacteriales bacterium]|nr:DUF6056 family protein [Eubacteriales bacterium]